MARSDDWTNSADRPSLGRDCLIYSVKTATPIVLLTIYAKSEQVYIAADEICRIITSYDIAVRWTDEVLFKAPLPLS